MQKITQEELQKLNFCTRGKGIKHSSSSILNIINEIKELKSSEILKLEKQDWPLKTSPRQRLRNIIPNIKISVLTLRDETGWIIIRL